MKLNNIKVLHTLDIESENYSYFLHFYEMTV
jgi:hypothetical protein